MATATDSTGFSWTNFIDTLSSNALKVAGTQTAIETQRAQIEKSKLEAQNAQRQADLLAAQQKAAEAQQRAAESVTVGNGGSQKSKQNAGMYVGIAFVVVAIIAGAIFFLRKK